MQSQAEITYNDTGSYASLFNTSAYDCIGPLSNMADSLTSQGITVKCCSRNSSSQNDVYQRFGVTAIIYDTNDFKAYSTDQNGVVTWDQKGVSSTGVTVTGNDVTMAWTTANSACTTNGGRLPSIEQLYSLGRAYGAASLAATGTTTYKPTSPGFVAGYYWSSTLVPSDGSLAYRVNFTSGNVVTSPTAILNYVRCVR
jgi:hypothetical protein